MALVAGAVVALSPGLARSAWADEVEFTISDAAIDESSGLAADPAAGWYWTVNDSGDQPRVYAIDPDGSTRGSVAFRAEVTDVEAVTRTPDGLLVADIGDNEGSRDVVTVYRLTELGLDGTSTFNAWDLAYADGASHDAEALVATADGRLLVITKEEEGGIWALPSSPSGAGVNTLERVGDAPAWVTDATVLPDGRLAVRGYTSVSILDPTSFDVVARAPLPLQPQGESITTTLDGEALLIGSEGTDSDVLRVAVPETVEDADESSAPPDPSAAPEPSADADPSGEATTDASGEATTEAEPVPTETGGGARTGTFLAVGLAALLAVAAGLVAALVGRRDAPTGPARPASGPSGASATAATDPDVAADVPAPLGTTESIAAVEAADGSGSPAASPGSPPRETSPRAEDAEPVEPSPPVAPSPPVEDVQPVDWSRPTPTPEPEPSVTPARAHPTPSDAEQRPTAPTGTSAQSDRAERVEWARRAELASAGYVLSEDVPGRMTWSEGADADGVDPDADHRDEGEEDLPRPRRAANTDDLDWLYEDR